MATRYQNNIEKAIDRFLDSTRANYLGEVDAKPIDLSELHTIASDDYGRVAFAERLYLFTQDPTLQALIGEYIETLMVDADMHARRAASWIEFIDRYPGRFSTGAVFGGSGALLFGAVAAGAIPFTGPAVLVAGGLFGLAGCIWGRHVLSQRVELAQRQSANLTRLKKLIESRHKRQDRTL